MLTGFDFPSAGTVELEGRDITVVEPAPPRPRRARAHVPAQPLVRRADACARTSRSRRSASGARPREARAARSDGCSSCSGSRARGEQPAGSLAHGDERKLGVARALATEPRFLLLDEPAAGLPEAEVPEFAAVVRSVRDDHEAGVLLIDHNMALVMDVCDRIQVLDQGRTLAEGTPAEIRANLDVAAAYLGEAPVVEA